MISDDSRSFHAVDYAIFALVLAVSLSIGFYHAFTGGRQRTTKEYLLANRQARLIFFKILICIRFIYCINTCVCSVVEHLLV